MTWLLFDLDDGEGFGANHLECHHMTYTEQPADQAQSAWVCLGRVERQVLLDSADLLL